MPLTISDIIQASGPTIMQAANRPHYTIDVPIAVGTEYLTFIRNTRNNTVCSIGWTRNEEEILRSERLTINFVTALLENGIERLDRLTANPVNPHLNVTQAAEDLINLWNTAAPIQNVKQPDSDIQDVSFD